MILGYDKMAEQAAAQSIMTSVMSNPTVAMIGVAAGYALRFLQTKMGGNNQGMGGF